MLTSKLGITGAKNEYLTQMDHHTCLCPLDGMQVYRYFLTTVPL